MEALVRRIDSFHKTELSLMWKKEFVKFQKCKNIKDEENKIGYIYKTLGAGSWARKRDNFREAIQNIVMEGDLTMKFDDILTELGEFGYYQKRLYLLLCMPSVINGCYMMILVFVMAPPQHRCKIPGYQNDTYAIQSEYHRSLINQTIPPSNDELRVYDRCHVYVTGNKSDLESQSKMKKCSEWVYDRSIFKQTFTSQFDLVCDDAIKTSVAQMIYYFGVLVGDLLFGLLSDTIGRKKTFSITIVILLAAAYGAAFAPEFYSFVVLEFVIGAAIHGAFMICCVLGVEMVGPSKRVWAGIPIHIFFAIGLVYLSGMEYFLRHWKWVQIACTTPAVFFLVYWWLIPESPRWLISQGRYEEADDIVQTAAKVNKVCLPKKTIDKTTLETPKEGRIWHLFQSRVLFGRTMILFYNWTVISMVYYGVTMHTGNLGGNFYLNFFILSVVEFPAKFTTLFLLDKMGRKKMHCLCMFIGGFACLCTIFTVIYGGDDLQPLTLTLAIIGKFGAAAAFGVIYTFSLELYPTVVRNSGMGMSSCVARIGGMVAPYVAKSGDLVGGRFGLALPLVIFGATTVLAGFLTILLPETLNQKLPETIEDGKLFGRKIDQDKKKDVSSTVVNSSEEETKESPNQIKTRL